MERTHNTVALTHTLSERDFLLIAFSRRVREKVCRRIFAESETEGHLSGDQEDNIGESERLNSVT